MKKSKDSAYEMIKYIDIDKTSLNAATIGPAAIAGSMPILAKKIGEKTPKKLPVKQAPISPDPTITARANGLAPKGEEPIKFIR